MIWKACILAISLCMDCFAVSTCSSVTLRVVRLRKTLRIGLIFGIVQAALFLVGWAFGSLLVGLVSQIARWIAFILLAEVGANMIREAFEKEQEVRNLNGIRNVAIGAVATSIDALIVGISMSMEMTPGNVIAADASAIFVFTVLSVLGGISAGSAIGSRYGRPAEFIGGATLVAIALLQVI